MEVGLVGKPNVGKSTMFNALTLLDVPMAPYPFTTVRPNRGVAAIRVPCPHPEKGMDCTPGNAPCRDGVRWVPVGLLDVPGLVPGAHEGRGLGHEFLDELRPASGLLQIVDLSGGTSAEGVLVAAGTQDPAEEVGWLEEELVHWIAGILGRDFERSARSLELDGGKLEALLERRLTGVSISLAEITASLHAAPIDREHPGHWSSADRALLARELLRRSKPRVIAANKSDRADAAKLTALATRVDPLPVIGTSAEAELTLRRAARAGLIAYRAGDPTFAIADPGRLSAPQAKALEGIRALLAQWGSTGVQQALEALVLGRLRQVPVFPVEDDAHWTDSRGRVLPDVLLVPAETSVREVAFRVHTDLGENFVRAIDGRTHRSLAADHVVTPGAVLRIVSRR
jgi:ribosome-binding ATPase